MLRRNFISGLFGLASGSILINSPELSEDIKKLVNIFGEDRIIRHVGEMLNNNEEITYSSLKRRLNRDKNKEARANKASKRRMNHSDIVIYRGPVIINDTICHIIDGLRPVRSGVTNKTLLVGYLPEAITLEQPLYHIPAGNRILVDNRREYTADSPCMMELVDTSRDKHPLRIHLWNKLWSDTPTNRLYGKFDYDK